MLTMNITIVKHHPSYNSAFKALNKAWIDEYFVMEEADYKSLDSPKEYILDKGGQILYAIENETPIGVCALIKMDDPRFDYELAKMAVKPSHHGKGIGKALALAIIAAAKKEGAKNLFVESNTILAPAISLYRKLGFVELEKFESPYQRSNIQMVLNLET